MKEGDAIQILNGVVAVDTQGVDRCDAVGCEKKCKIQGAAGRVLDTNFDQYAWGDLVFMCKSQPTVAGCAFQEIQTLARELAQKA
jgi:hypothetical protein